MNRKTSASRHIFSNASRTKPISCANHPRVNLSCTGIVIYPFARYFP
jgi:hypothetical protein